MKFIYTSAIAAMLLIMFAMPGKSQDLQINEKTKKYVSESVLSFNTLSKDTLFKRTLKWLYKQYPNTGKKGTYINAIKNKIITLQYYNPDPYKTWNYSNLRIGFVLTCDVNEHKIKYNYTDFYYFSTGDGKVLFESLKFQNYDKEIRDRMLKETNEYIKKSMSDLVTFLQTEREKATSR